MDYDKLRKLNDDIFENSVQLTRKQMQIVDSIDRSVGICEQNKDIVENIERSFLEKTKLEKKIFRFC